MTLLVALSRGGFLTFGYPRSRLHLLYLTQLALKEVIFGSCVALLGLAWPGRDKFVMLLHSGSGCNCECLKPRRADRWLVELWMST